MPGPGIESRMPGQQNNGNNNLYNSCQRDCALHVKSSQNWIHVEITYVFDTCKFTIYTNFLWIIITCC